MVAHLLPKQAAVGSNPITRSYVKQPFGLTAEGLQSLERRNSGSKQLDQRDVPGKRPQFCGPFCSPNGVYTLQRPWNSGDLYSLEPAYQLLRRYLSLNPKQDKE